MTMPKFIPYALSILCVASAMHVAALELEVVGEKFLAPIFITAPPGDTERIFVVDQFGTITIILTDGNVELATLFLDISGIISAGGERGLLGMAFHPDYDDNGFFFLHYSDTSGDTVIEQYTVSGDLNVADPTSGVIFLQEDQPFSNHNGGTIAFKPGDPNHYLYVALGDGGSRDDPHERGQDLTSRLGKILRIDVDAGPGATPDTPIAPESNPFVDGEGPNEDLIWAYGLRNPWRFSFDKATGDMYIGDVGQDAIEEVDFWPADMPDGGANFGWDLLEGMLDHECGELCDDARANTELPIHEYGRSDGFSVIGGYVYRGTDLPSMEGRYVFGDYGGVVWSFAFDGTTVSDLQNHTVELVGAKGVFPQILSFGEDGRGELYVCTKDGRVSKIVGPSVTVEQGATQDDPAMGLPVVFDVEFSTDVTGFDVNDVRVEGTAADPEFVVDQVDGDSYTISVTSASSNGTLIATVDAGAALDAANDPTSMSSSADNSVTLNIDMTRPEVSVEQADGQDDPAMGFPIVFDVEFSEGVTGFTVDDVNMYSTASGVSFEVNAVDPATYTIEITSILEEGLVSVRPSIVADAAMDAAGNLSMASTSIDNEVTIDVDLTGPEVTVEQGAGQMDPTNVFPIVFDVEFDEEVMGFDATDVAMGGSAEGVNFEVNQVDQASYTIEITASMTPGTVIPSIPQGAAVDASGNSSAASTSTDNIVTILEPSEMKCNMAAGQSRPRKGPSADFILIALTMITLVALGRREHPVSS